MSAMTAFLTSLHNSKHQLVKCKVVNVDEYIMVL